MSASGVSRLPTVDALRGVASLWVAVFHLRAALGDEFQDWLPRWIDYVLSVGFVGVAIFFVISGFVIALTLAGRSVDCETVGRFALRRSIRLDPPYWVAIAAEIALIYLSLSFFPDDTRASIPSGQAVVAHMFYLQDILGFGNIAAIFWTLCIELQFYFFFAISLAIVQRGGRLVVDGNGDLSARALLWFVGAAVYCMMVMCELVQAPWQGLFFGYWPYFFAGVLAAWTYRLGLKRWYFYAYLASMIGCGAVHLSAYLVAAICTAVLLFVVARLALFQRVLAFRWLVYLGTISYSLYLFHSIVGWRFVRLVKVLVPDSAVGVGSIVLFVGALGVSVFAAHVAFLIIERPSMSLARKIRY